MLSFASVSYRFGSMGLSSIELSSIAGLDYSFSFLLKDNALFYYFYDESRILLKVLGVFSKVLIKDYLNLSIFWSI